MFQQYSNIHLYIRIRAYIRIRVCYRANDMNGHALIYCMSKEAETRNTVHAVPNCICHFYTFNQTFTFWGTISNVIYPKHK